MTGVVLARREAMKRNGSVSMTEAAGGWAQGWTVSAGALTLRTQDPYGGGVNITNSAALTAITYSNDGRLASPTTDFTFAPADSSAQGQTRCMRIRPGGTPSSKTGYCTWAPPRVASP